MREIVRIGARNATRIDLPKLVLTGNIYVWYGIISAYGPRKGQNAPKSLWLGFCMPRIHWGDYRTAPYLQLLFGKESCKAAGSAAPCGAYGLCGEFELCEITRPSQQQMSSYQSCNHSLSVCSCGITSGYTDSFRFNILLAQPTE